VEELHSTRTLFTRLSLFFASRTQRLEQPDCVPGEHGILLPDFLLSRPLPQPSFVTSYVRK